MRGDDEEEKGRPLRILAAGADWGLGRGGDRPDSTSPLCFVVGVFSSTVAVFWGTLSSTARGEEERLVSFSSLSPESISTIGICIDFSPVESACEVWGQFVCHGLLAQKMKRLIVSVV